MGREDQGGCPHNRVKQRCYRAILEDLEGKKTLELLISRLLSLVTTHECGHGVAIPHHSPIYGGDRKCVMRYIFRDIRGPAPYWNPNAPRDPWLTRNMRPWPKKFCAKGDDCYGKIDVSDN